MNAGRLKIGIFVGLVLLVARAGMSALQYVFFMYWIEHWHIISIINSFTTFLGLALVVACSMLWFFNRRKSKPVTDKKRRVATTLALGTGIIFNLLVLVSTIPFLSVPRGRGIRPMGWAMFVFEMAFLALVIGLPMTIIGFVTERSRRLNILATCLALTPLPLAIILLRVLAAACGFVCES
jgi:hypothetical protein